MSVSKAQLEHDLAVIAKATDKNERLAWIRKRKKMDDILAQLEPIEEGILKLMAQKQPILDELTELREIMVIDCVHPEDLLVHYGTHLLCKFCEKKIIINRSLEPIPPTEELHGDETEE